MPDVTVRVLLPFEYRGRALRPGQHLAMAPVDAAIAARTQHVSLSVAPGAVPDPLEDEPTPKRRRTYRRRDLVAESAE